MTAGLHNTHRVLYVGAGAPWRGGAGYLVRQAMLLDALASLKIDLHLAMFDVQDPGSPPYGTSMTILPNTSRIVEGRVQSLIRDFTCPQPMMIRLLDCDAPRKAMAQLNPASFDAIVAYRCDFAHIAGVIGHRRLILDIDDPEHMRRAEAAKWTDDGNARWQRALDLRRLRRFELQCAKRASACFVCQQRDAIPFSDVGIKPIIVPNCVDVPAVCPTRNADSPTVVFVGNMQGGETSPNVDGMRWLTRDVWPHIHSQMPDAQCVIAGPIRSQWRDELSGMPGVRVLGFVDDLSSLFRSAALSVAPIRYGTGTRIKILEAMANACPVVSTTKGCEGLEMKHQRELMIRDEPDDFAEACVRILRDDELGKKLGRAGWEAVSGRYNRSTRKPWLAGVLAGLLDVRESAAEPDVA